MKPQLFSKCSENQAAINPACEILPKCSKKNKKQIETQQWRNETFPTCAFIIRV